MGFAGGSVGKEPTCQHKRHRRLGFNPWVGKIPWRRKWQPTPAFLPGESHGQRSPWGRRESDTTEHTHRTEMSGCQGLGEGGAGTGLSFEGREKVWTKTPVMLHDTQHTERH